jgi:tryptophanyl-tRNA synthetase
MMADMHAITVPHEPKELLASTRSTTALYLACGIDPEKAAVFVQSHISAHAELAWMLQCYTPIGWLRKMIQFKTKSEKQVGCQVCFTHRTAMAPGVAVCSAICRQRVACMLYRVRRSARGS